MKIKKVALKIVSEKEYKMYENIETIKKIEENSRGYYITAEFDEEIIEGSIKVKGHIRLIHALTLFLGLWFNKTIRSWFKK